MTITYQQLTELAQNIKDAAKQANALQLLEDMQMEIVGIGDEPVRWRPSFVRVVQGTTDTSKIADKVSVGDIVWGDNARGSTAEVIPLSAYQGRQMWDPDPNKTVMICSSPDAKTGFRYGDCKKCAFSKFDEAAKKSACSANYTFYVLAPDFSSVGQVSFSKTSYANGSAWFKLLRRNGYPYTNLFNLKTKKSTQHKNVSLLEAEGVAGKIKYGEGEEAFVKTLFLFFHESREEFLKVWTEEHKNPQQSAPALEGGTTSPQLSHTILDGDVSGEASPEAQKYEM